jgi:hypothetical protein
MDGLPELLTKVCASVTTERGIRWIGVFLVVGALAQLWASWLMSGRFNHPASGNGAVASLLRVERIGRAVPDPGRSKYDTLRNPEWV